MIELLNKVIEAHGGAKRWKQAEKATVTITSDGLIFDLQKIARNPTPRQVAAWLHEERVITRPVGGPDNYIDFNATHIALKKTGGDIVMERKGSPEELHRYIEKNPWEPLDFATFSSYAMWTYLTTPFFMLLPGFEYTELQPWKEKGEEWRGLRIKFPDNILSHSQFQDLYFGEDFLLRRHDYYMALVPGYYATQYVYDMHEVDGFKLPLKRRAYKRAEDGTPMKEQLMISLDFSNVYFN